MSFDTFILIFSALKTFIFIVMHITIFRYLSRKSILQWISYLFFVVTLLGFACEFFILYSYFRIDVITILQILLITFIIYSLSAFIYIADLFGSIESAIRINLLDIINLNSETGIKYSKLIKKYNKNIIIRKRLDRLVASKELDYKNMIYRLNNQLSLIFIPVLLTKLICKFYGLENKLINKSYIR